MEIEGAHTELAKRAVASKHWRWMEGMLATPAPLYYGRDFRVVFDDCGAIECVTADHSRSRRELRQDCMLPDLTNPATLGCLLALARDAWSRPGITTKCHPVLDWIVIDGADDFLKSVACDTEAEALVAALEAAP